MERWMDTAHSQGQGKLDRTWIDYLRDSEGSDKPGSQLAVGGLEG